MKRDLTIVNGWVMVCDRGNIVWPESFSHSRKTCLATAIEFWDSHGETRKKNYYWKPQKCTAQFIVAAKFGNIGT